MSDNRKRRIDQFFLFYSARADSWRNIANLARAWAAGLADAKGVKDAIADIAIIEEFHASPGPGIMRMLAQHVETGDADEVAALTRRICEAILFEGGAASMSEGAADGESERIHLDVPSRATGGNGHGRPYF